MLKGIIFSLILVASFTFVSCGGGSSSVVDTVDTVDTGEETTLTFPYPDFSSFSAENIALAKAVKETDAALLQTILLINRYMYTNPKKTDFDTFEERRLRAIAATEILIEKVDITLEKEAAEAASIAMASQKLLPSQLKNEIATDIGDIDIDDTIISPTPYGGNRPIKTLMEEYSISAEMAREVLLASAGRKTIEAYTEIGDSWVAEQKAYDLKMESVALGGVIVCGGWGLAAIAKTATVATAVSTLVASKIALIGGLAKWIYIARTLEDATVGRPQSDMPGAFAAAINISEIASVVTLANGVDVLIYSSGKLVDLLKSEGKVVTFGTAEVRLDNTAVTHDGFLESFIPGLENYPTLSSGEYMTSDGEEFSVFAIPLPYKETLSDLVAGDSIQLFDGPDSCPMTYDPLLDPDNDYAYNINIHDKDNNGLFEDRIECSYYPSGSIYTEFPYIDDKLNGDKKRYYETGILEVYTHYVDDIMHGTTRWYHESGNLAAETLWVDGVMNGLKTVYYDSDQVYYTMMIIDGKAEGEVREYYETGELHWIVPYVNDQVNGVTKEFYLSEKLHWETTYVAGIKEGPSTGYFETGEKQFIMNYVNDKLDGHFFELDIYGNVIVCYLYEDDVVVDDDFCHDQFTI